MCKINLHGDDSYHDIIAKSCVTYLHTKRIGDTRGGTSDVLGGEEGAFCLAEAVDSLSRRYCVGSLVKNKSICYEARVNSCTL